MENKKLILFIITCTSILFLSFIMAPVSALSEKNNNAFSFRFENCTVDDALREISAKSGIKIISKNGLKKEILIKSYSKRNIDSIIADLLRGENCSVVWNYSDGYLVSISLYTPDEAKGNSGRPTEAYRAIRENGRNSFSGNREIDEVIKIRENKINGREVNSRNRSNTSFPASRRPVEKNTSGKINTENNTVYGTASRTNTESKNVSGTSNVSANIRRSIISKQNNETKVADEEVVTKPQPSPEPPEPEKGNGLERPPMPPGL